MNNKTFSPSAVFTCLITGLNLSLSFLGNDGNFGSPIFLPYRANTAFSTFLPPRIFYQKIKPRWKRIVLWYNNDFPKKINTGIINAKKIAKEYDIEFVFQPDGLEKDPSDFRDVYGHRNFVELCNTLLNL